MRITKEQLKSEIDKVRDENLEVLYRIVIALEAPASDEPPPASSEAFFDPEEWRRFIAETYGSCADSPIERGEPSFNLSRRPA